MCHKKRPAYKRQWVVSDNESIFSTYYVGSEEEISSDEKAADFFLVPHEHKNENSFRSLA